MSIKRALKDWWDEHEDQILMLVLGTIAIAICIGLFILAGSDNGPSPY